ncbi:NAD(P)/FAD-dependent oxidoreductase [Nocardia fusca]|uniref:NAD(P)/FAD-dependent oxidoreductase n=1 Tax=Nocardia fusca TaxID=941183 RepID=UPI0037C5126D
MRTNGKVLVIGGGPGGSTAATLLAQAGMDVQLLEREHFPRYHIGESLASSCRILLEQTGVLEKIDSRGYPVKRGALLRWGVEEDWMIDWSSLFGDNVSSWQVDRDDFDSILLDHARSNGVKITEGATVKKDRFRRRYADCRGMGEFQRGPASHRVRLPDRCLGQVGCAIGTTLSRSPQSRNFS